MSTKDTTYNGWKNYETWSVALIADNDQGLYEERKEVIRSAIKSWDAMPDEFGSVRLTVADAIQEWVNDWYEVEQLEESEGNYLIKQLFRAALGEVDWFEIADNWMSE